MFTTTVGRRATSRFGRKAFEIMTAREPAPRKPSRQSRPEEFEGFVDRALRDHATGTSELPQASELEPRQLLRYAAGKANEDERLLQEDFVKRSSWAYDRVIALVKANRPKTTGLANGIARRLLAGNGTKAAVVVGEAVLEADGVEGSPETAWKKLEKSGDDKTRVACLLGLGRTQDARKIVEKNKSSKELVWNLLRRVSSAASNENESGPGRSRPDGADDEALLALLDVFPSLLGDNSPSKRR